MLKTLSSAGLRALVASRDTKTIHMAVPEPGHSSVTKSDSDATPKAKRARVFDFRKYARRHIALKISYLGWDYHGFAIQDTAPNTIEARLFEALEKVKLVEDIRNCSYTRCGRTDKGVSALGQVVSLCVRSNLLEGKGVEVEEDCTAHERKGDKSEELPYMVMLNSNLPRDIRVLAWAPIDRHFSARFSCLHRTYKYFFPRGDVNINAMREAAQKFVGEHDFRNFCRMDIKGGVTNFRRRILSINITELTHGGDSPYQQCEVTIVGLAFLWHQVRCMVAILFLIGHSLESSEVIDHMLDVGKCPSKPQYGMASELPLVLYDSVYEGLEWRRDEKNYASVVSQFQRMWTEMAIKGTMMRRMLDSLELSLLSSHPSTGQLSHPPTGQSSHPSTGQLHHPPTAQLSSLISSDHRLGGAYKPLLLRPTGETFEERFEHHQRKRKRQQEDNHDT